MSRSLWFSVLVACPCALAASLFAAQATASWPTDPTANLAVCTVAGEQSLPTVLSDGRGGAYVLWRDRRSGSYDLYCQRVSADGIRLWTADGHLLPTGSADIVAIAAAPDAEGGFFVAYETLAAGVHQVSVQHVAFDERDNVIGRRTQVMQATAGFMPALAAGASRQVIVTWAVELSPVDSIRTEGYVPDPTDATRWLRSFHIASNLVELARMAMIDDGRSGAWVTEVGTGDQYRLNVSVRRIRANGVLVSSTSLPMTGSRTDPDDYTEVVLATPDGGALVTWDGSASVGPGPPDFGTNDIFTARLDTLGHSTVAVLGNETPTLARPDACPDGEGGAIVTWASSTDEIYARRVTSLGTAVWPSSGVWLSQDHRAANNTRARCVPTSDGGAVVVWLDDAADIRAQRVTHDGWRAWDQTTALCTAVGVREPPVAIADGADGAFVVWRDKRTETAGDIYMQRVRGHGCLDAAAMLTAVSDVHGDQGGRVRVAWNASPLDQPSNLGIAAYGIWRRLDGEANRSARAAGARLLSSSPHAEDARPGVLRMVRSGTEAIFWEGVGMVLARGQPSYTFVAGTLADSTPGMIPWEVFMVDAHERDYPVFWDSAPDSGYSVDNLAPPAPAVLSGSYSGGVTSLHWTAVIAPDLAGYRVHRGESMDFTPSPDNLVAEIPDTAFVDAPGGPRYYKVAALDVHGNEGAAATFDPGIPVEAPGDALPAGLWLANAAPNPSVNEVVLRFALPREGRVDLAVLDAQGRRVRTLVREYRVAGPQTVVWDGRDHTGRPLGSGVYVVRLAAHGGIVTRKLLRIR